MCLDHLICRYISAVTQAPSFPHPPLASLYTALALGRFTRHHVSSSVSFLLLQTPQELTEPCPPDTSVTSPSESILLVAPDGHGKGIAGVVGPERRRRRRLVLEPARARPRAGAAGVCGEGASRGDEPRARAVRGGHGAHAAVAGPRRPGARRHGRRRCVRHHGARNQAVRGAGRRGVVRHCRPLRASLRVLLHRVRRRHARRRRRLQLPPRHLRGIRGVPDGREPDHGVRLLQRRRGAQLHGVPRHGGRRGRAQQVAPRRAGPPQGVQRGRSRRRRRHPPHLRLHLLQHQGELGGEHGSDGGPRGVHPVHHRHGLLARRRPQPDASRRPGAPGRFLPARRRRRVRRGRHGVPELHRLRRRVHHGRGGGAARPRHPHRRLGLRRPRHRALLPHGRLHVHASPLRRDRHGGALLRRVQGELGVGVGVERDRRRREPRHPDVADGSDAGPGQVPLRHRPLRRHARLARQGAPQDGHARQCLSLPRAFHGGARALHGAGHPPEPRLHRHALRLLHGGQRRRVPPLRCRQQRRLADARVHPHLLPDHALLHAGVEAGAARGRQGRAPRGVRGLRGGHGRRVPGAGAAGARARAVGRAWHAVGAGGVRLSQRFPARVAGPAVLHPVRVLLGGRRAGVRALQRARQLRRRGERRARRCQGAGRSLQGVATS